MKPKKSDRDDCFSPNPKKQISWFDRIPYPIKAIVFKYWFFGLNFFLIQMGLGYLFPDSENIDYAIILMLISGFFQGVVNDLFVYNILDTVENYPGQAKWWILFKNKKVYSLLINVAYGLVWGVLSGYTNGIFATLITASWPESWFFKEPFSWAVVAFVIDGVFVGIKDLIYYLVTKNKEKEENV